jgi:hypothetical protein
MPALDDNPIDRPVCCMLDQISRLKLTISWTAGSNELDTVGHWLQL